MCGRFAFYSPREAVANLFGVELPPDLPARYNIAPSQQVVALRAREAGAAEAVFLKWGLVPSWARDPAIGSRMINARAETLAEKPAFRDAFRSRRCVILASGFYEWRKTAGGSTPYYITTPDGPAIAFAGLWEQWQKADRTIDSCTIITTEANRVLRELHDRMPAVLCAADARLWLTRDAPAPALAALLRPAPDGLLVCREVSRSVNRPENDGPELIAAR